MQQNKKYYDNIYRDSLKYLQHYSLSNYYPMWQKVSDLISPSDCIIDVGCGTGQFAEMMYDKFGPEYCYTGVDFSGIAIKMARKKVPYQFFWQDALKYVKNNGHLYDIYVMLELLEHIENDIELITSIPARAGIIFSVPSYDSEAHVRTFNKPDEISERYGELININEIYKINFTETRFITIVKAVRR